MTLPTVREWMTRTPLSVSPGASLRKACALMKAGRVCHLPVIDGKKLVGLLAQSDIWTHCPKGTIFLEEQQAEELLESIRVGGVMMLHPACVSPDASLLEAAWVMRERKVRALPVVDGKDVVGIITESDVIGAFVALYDRLGESALGEEHPDPHK